MSKQWVVLIIAFGIFAAGIILFGIHAMWWGLNITIQPQNVLNILAPLLLTAGFIERAVEVVITPWRDQGANEKKAELAKANAGSDQAAKDSANTALNDYVSETTRYAFIVAFMFGLAAAMVGVRALWPFLSADAQAMATFKSVTTGQQNTFIVLDVVLSAALMAGGADGIHSVITAFTSFFDASSQKSQNSAKS